MKYALLLLAVLAMGAAPADKGKPATQPGGKPADVPAKAPPPLAWKMKSDAPPWVAEYIQRWEKARDYSARKYPLMIEQKEQSLAKMRAGKIDPSAKVGTDIKGNYRFKSQKEKDEFLAVQEKMLEDFKATLVMATDPEYIPDYKPPSGEKPFKDHLERKK